MKRLVLLSLILSLVFLGAAEVEIGPGLGIFQDYEGSEINFTQKKNFSALNVFPYTTGFETSNFTASTIPYDPVAYYPLDGSREDLVGTNDITEGSSDLGRGVLGEKNGSRYFDGSGSDYLKVSDPKFGIADSQSVTVSVWQKGDGQPREDTSFAGHDASGNQRQIWAHAPWSDENIYWDTTETFDGDGSRIEGTPSGSVDWDEWHHYLFVHNADTGRKEIWFDGTRIASSSSETQTFEEIVEFYIGTGSESNSRSYQGRIDNLAIYNRSLSSSEIQYVYENTDGGETDIQMDFYEYSAGLQSYVSNFSAQTSSNTAHFKAGNLAGDLFYEAFDSVTGERFYIGYTQDEVFNFTIPDFTSEEVSVFHYGEKGAAIDNITFNDSSPVEGETLGIEEEIFNEGVVDDEAVNKTLTISTYNGSGWEQEQFRTEDLAVPVNSTETQQSFTAQFRGSFENTTQYRGGGGQLGLGYQNGTSGDNLVGYWRMDQAVSGSGGTVVDYSGENNDGNTRNGVTTGTTGTFSTDAFDFDGSNDYVEIPHDSSIVPTEGTFSIWVSPGRSLSDDGYIVDKNLNSKGYGFIQRSDDTVDALVTDSGGLEGITGSSLPTKSWSLLTLTWDSGNEIKFFVNGERKGTSSFGTADLGTDSLHFGKIQDYSDFHFDGKIDEPRIYKKSLSTSEVKDLYFHGAPFHGNYTTKKIDNGELTHWYRVNLDASVPEETDLEAEFRALDSSGSVVGTDSFSVEDGDHYYNVSVPDSEDAELYLNGSSENLTKSWEVDSLKVISGGPYVDPWEVRPGPWRFNVSLDPNDVVKETNESNNDASGIVDVPSYQVFYGDSQSARVAGNASKEIFRWDPEVDQGNIFFFDTDSEFDYFDLEPVTGSDLVEVDDALNLSGHNDSSQELWDRDDDGSIDRTNSWDVGGRTLNVPVTNSTEDSEFDTGILYDSGDGSPYDGSQDLVFVTRILPGTTGGYGTYDYEARVPFSLDSQRPGSDIVSVETQLD